MDKKNFIKRIFLVFFPGNSIRVYIKNDVLKAKIKNFKGKEIELISPKYNFSLGENVMLESIFEGAYYQAEFQIKDIKDFGKNEIMISLNLIGTFKIKNKRISERHYISIPVLIEDTYRGLIWDLNENFLGVIILNEYLSIIRKNLSIKLSIVDFNITFHGTIAKIRQEFFNLSKFIYEIKILQDPTGLFGKYLEHIGGKNFFENKKIRRCNQMNNENFEFFMSAFKEITNIGMGNAVSSLSMMLNKKVDISVPNLDVIKLSDIFLNMEEPDEIYACSYVKMEGDLDSSLVFLIEKDSVKRLIKESVGIDIKNIVELDEMSTSMIGELGNIMFGSYTSAISQFLNINLQVTPHRLL